jgi:hypothetical protein
MTRIARLPPSLTRRRPRKVRAALIALALFAAACSDPVAPASPTPVDPTTTDSFAGTLVVAGSNVHPFNVSQVGRVRVTLTDLPAGVTVTLSIGTLTGPVCVPVDRKDVQASATPQLLGTATITGVFCISVSDTTPSTLTEPVAYSVTVAHS